MFKSAVVSIISSFLFLVCQGSTNIYRLYHLTFITPFVNPCLCFSPECFCDLSMPSFFSLLSPSPPNKLQQMAATP